MKKNLLLLSLLVVPFSMSLVACEKEEQEEQTNQDDGPKEHTAHTWKKEWAYDEENHWLQCSGCDATNFKGAHTWDEGTITTPATETNDGVKTFKCTRCSTTKTESFPYQNNNNGNGNGNGGGEATTSEVDGYVMVDSIDDVDNLYIVSSADGLTYNAMTAEIKGEDLPWYLCFAVTDFEMSKTGFVQMEENGEEFKFTKQSDGSYTIQAKNNNYVYCYIEGTHYSIGLCDSTTAPKNGTVYWDITKDTKGFVIKGKTVSVYLQQYLSFCGSKEKPGFPIYLFEKGKVTITNNGGNGNGDSTYTGTIAEDSRWNLNFTQYGYTFRDSLATLMRAKVKTTTTYSACLEIGKSAAAKDSGYVPFYHNEVHAKNEDANREHTWPNSRGGGSDKGGAEIEKDPYMVRPTLTVDNSARGNKFYGLGSNEWDPASCGFEGARGESARVIFYVATKFGKTHGLTLSNNPGDASSKKTMGTLKTLMEWNRKYPVTDMEKQINNNLEKAGFGRNPFVDHPEYAEFIWTTSGVQTAVPNIDVGGSGSGGSGGESGGQGGGGGQEIPPTTYEYSLVANLNELDGQSAFIVHEGKALTSVNGSESRPWYFNAVDADISSDKTGLNVSGAQKFTFTKISDGVFTMKTPENKYLYSYIDGTHYSIGLKADATDINFTIEALSDGYTIKGTNTNVYIKLGSPSFQGTSTKPTTPIYLYK